MPTDIENLTLTKPIAAASVLILAIMPWFQGGRDPVGWMILLAVGLLGGFVVARSSLKLSVSRLGIIWALLVAWTGLSLLWSVNRYQSFTSLMLLAFLGVVAAIAAAIRTQKSAVELWTIGYLAVAGITSLMAFYFFIRFSYDRAVSTFYLPNPLAAFLIPAIIIGLWLFLQRRSLFGALSSMLTLGAFFLTDSRGGTIVLVVTLVLAGWLSPGWIKQWRRLALVILGGLSIALLANLVRMDLNRNQAQLAHRYSDLASSTSTSDRVYYLKSALAIWADRPLVGGGAGTYATLHPKYQYRVISAGANPHNLYVQVLAELGLVGFGLLVWLLIVLIIGVIRGVKRHPERLPLALGLLALMLHSAIDIETSYPTLLVLMAVLVGLTFEPKAQPDRDSSLIRWLPVTASLLLAVPTIWLFRGQIAAKNGQISQSNGDFDKAADYYQLATSHPPYDPDWFTARGINLLTQANGADRSNRLAEAAGLAEAAIKIDPDDSQHDLLLGRVRLAQRDQSAAEAAYKAAISKDPYNHPEYYNDLATVYLQQNKLSAATSTAGVIIDLYPESVIANRNGDPTIAPAVATSYVITAQVAVKQGNLDVARTQLHRALAIDPSNLAAKFVLQQIGE